MNVCVYIVRFFTDMNMKRVYGDVCVYMYVSE